AENLQHVPLEAAGRHRDVQFRLDHDAPADQVKAAGEPQNGGDLRLSAAGTGDGEPADLVLHRCRHRHGPILPCIRKIRSYAAANSSGSCRGLPSGRATGASSTAAPNRLAASVSESRSGTAASSASTTSRASLGACRPKTSK